MSWLIPVIFGWALILYWGGCYLFRKRVSLAVVLTLLGLFLVGYAGWGFWFR